MDCQNIFGGGMMGDVIKSTEINIGRNKTALASESSFTNKDIFIHGNIYGGNDVSGYVNINDNLGYFADNGGGGTHINIYGGRIDGDVYGAGMVTISMPSTERATPRLPSTRTIRSIQTTRIRKPLHWYSRYQ